MYKNRAVSGFPFGLVSVLDGTPIVAGVVTGYYTLDGGAQAAIADTPVHEGNGQWTVNLSAAETNGNMVGLAFVHATALPCYFTIPTSIAAGGANTWTYTLTEEGTGTPIVGADVWVTSDLAGAVIIASGKTDAFGVVTFYLDSGSYYIWRALAGWDFVNPDLEIVP